MHFICVGTPQTAGAQKADMSQVFGSVDVARPAPAPGRPGRRQVDRAGRHRRRARGSCSPRRAADGVEVAWNPEFLREGFAVEDTLRPDRLVVGVRSQRAEDRLREVYAPIIAEGVPFLVTDFPTAELVKVAANAFLATKISFINAMAEVCEAAGADVTQLADAIGYDPRIGSRFLDAGLGFGGGCLPKDIRAFMARAGELGAEDAVAFLREVDQINLRRRAATVDLAREALGGDFRGRRITVLGATFKPNSDDVRDSPALDVAVAMSNAGRRRRRPRPQGPGQRPARLPAHDATSPTSARRSPAPSSSCSAPSGASTASSTRPRSATSWPTGTSSTPATRSTRPPGATPAGRTARSAGPPREPSRGDPRGPHGHAPPGSSSASRDNPAREAYRVAAYLQQQGKRIVPIHPRAEVVHGEQGYPTIAEAAAALGAPDVVDVFINSERAGRFADEAVAAGAGVVWFQEGVIDDDAAQRVVDAGVDDGDGPLPGGGDPPAAALTVLGLGARVRPADADGRQRRRDDDDAPRHVLPRARRRS